MSLISKYGNKNVRQLMTMYSIGNIQMTLINNHILYIFRNKIKILKISL